MADTPYEIGIATADITPPLGVMLAGYGSRKDGADEVGHPLRAEALACKDADGNAWVLVTSDVVGYPMELVERVRAVAAKALGLAPEAICISATHTHSGPAAVRAYLAELSDVDHQYRKDILEPQLAQVIIDACSATEPGTFEVAMTEAPDLASNRRVLGDDGTATNDWQDPDGNHTGYFDSSVMLIGVRRPGGELAALLVNYGVHPVALGPRSLAISTDYPGYMKDTIEQCHAGTTALYALAGGGNINPRDCIKVGPDHPRKMGEALGEIVCQAIPNLEPVAAGPVASHRQPWTMISQRQWPEGSGRSKGDEITSEIMALRAGDLAIATVPGELFSEYVAMIRKASPLPHTAVVSMANASIGYFPLDEAQSQGGLEIRLRAADALEGPFMEHTLAALKAVTD